MEGLIRDREVFARLEFLEQQEVQINELMIGLINEFEVNITLPRIVHLRLQKAHLNKLQWRGTFNNKQRYVKILETEYQSIIFEVLDSVTCSSYVYFERQRLLLNSRMSSIHSEARCCRLLRHNLWAVEDFIQQKNEIT